ncbi:MAG: MFS transporter, partial [Pseudomonadota bacterium]
LIIGGAAAQFPAGWLADRYDRRWVLIAFSLASIAACGISALSAAPAMAIAASALFGFLTFPIYSISAAHAHDFAKSHERAELSAALLFYFAVGAIVSPLAVSRLIETYGPASFFAFIAVGHLALVLYSLVRMRRRPTAEERTSYIYAPRTSFLVGRLLRRERDKAGPAAKGDISGADEPPE